MIKVILGSNSPRRKELLSKIIKNFEVIPSNFDEESIKCKEKNPKELVKILSRKKGEEIYSRIKIDGDFLIISSDTIVCLNNQLLGKPKDKKEAYKMLKSLSNNKHTVYTGLFVLINKNNKQDKILTYSKTDVYFKKITDKEILKYINSENTLDKAGAYAIQGNAKNFVEKIEGNIETVIGLDIEKLSEILKQYF